MSEKRTSRLVALGVLVLLMMAAGSARAQEVTFPHLQFDAALEEAREDFGGELLLYYVRPGADAEAAVEAELLADDVLAAYINSHFARYAVGIRSGESEALQRTYGLMEGETNPDLQPAIAVISLDKHDVHLKYWERGDEVDPAAFEAWLREIKERE